MYVRVCVHVYAHAHASVYACTDSVLTSCARCAEEEGMLCVSNVPSTYTLACTDCVQIMRRIRAFCEHKRRQTDISNVLEFCEHKEKGTSHRPKQVIHSCIWTRLSSSLSHPWSVTFSESTCARVDAVRVNLSRKQSGTYIHMCVCMSLCAQLIHSYTGVHKYLMLRHCVYVCMM